MSEPSLEFKWMTPRTLSITDLQLSTENDPSSEIGPEEEDDELDEANRVYFEDLMETLDDSDSEDSDASSATETTLRGSPEPLVSHDKPNSKRLTDPVVFTQLSYLPVRICVFLPVSLRADTPCRLR